MRHYFDVKRENLCGATEAALARNRRGSQQSVRARKDWKLLASVNSWGGNSELNSKRRKAMIKTRAEISGKWPGKVKPW